jgi:hypothetical protein
MIKRMKIKSIIFILMILVLLVPGCIKETYNMNMLSKKAHLSPTVALSAVKGDISFSDAVKPNDTLVFDQNKLVTFIFKMDSIVNLKPADFSKGVLVKTATILPGSYDLNINDFLSHISGDFLFANPTLKFIYTNSFPDSVRVNLSVRGERMNKSVNLKLSPFGLNKPNFPVQQDISSFHLIDKTNSNLPALVSLPPEMLYYSGDVVLTASVKSNPDNNDALIPTHMIGSLELEVPLELKINNLQFTDTVDNFIKDGNNSDGQIKVEDFQSLRVIISAKNGFPLGASVKMSLYNSTTHSVLKTIDAAGFLEPAPVDSNGKITSETESSTNIDFNKDFFSSVNKADKIIFRFTFVSTGSGSQNVKIYSDYRIKFTAALVIKPDINLK